MNGWSKGGVSQVNDGGLGYRINKIARADDVSALEALVPSLVGPDELIAGPHLDRSAIMLCAGWGANRCIRYLLEIGAHPDGRSSTPETALMFAASIASTTRLLLDGGADPNGGSPPDSLSPLWATMFHPVRNARVFRLLLDAGADPFVRSQRGLTPAEYAKGRLRDELDDFLASTDEIRAERPTVERADDSWRSRPGVSPLLAALERVATQHLEPRMVDGILALARPAVWLQHDRSQEGPTGSHLGGAALLDPEGESWPVANGRPLALLAVIDLADLAELRVSVDLPSSGVLNMFYDSDEQPWGAEIGEGWQVVLVDRSRAVVTPAPAGAPTFVETAVQLVQIVSVPDVDDPSAAPVSPLYDDDCESVSEALARYERFADEWRSEMAPSNAPLHQVGGYPTTVQGPVFDDAPDLEPADRSADVGDMQLLMQIDTDDDLGWMWGDGGSLFFGIRSSPSAPARFECGWMSLQCC